MTLGECAKRWAVDKLHRHSYIPLYEELLSPIAPVCGVRLFEFGIGYKELMEPFVPVYHHGASLRMWSDYMPKAEIYAADHHQHALVNEGRIRSYLCDQSRRWELLRLANSVPHLDVFIDDGSHQLSHQILTAAIFLERLSPGGIYVIEDVYRDTGAELASMFNGQLHCFDKTPDDNIVVIRA